MAEIILRTPRLLLRTEAEGDQAEWAAHLNTPEVMARLGGPQTGEQIGQRFRRMAEGWAEDGFSFMLIERIADGLLIGQCGLSRIRAAPAPAALAGQVQIGWTLRHDCWGRGYAREGAEAVLALAFARHGLATVHGQTSLSNAPSWRLMEALGMARRADLDYADADYPPEDNPTMVYALDGADWRGRAAQRG